jgi:hypothetical protein
MLMTLLGFPWAIAMWAPLSLVSQSHRILVICYPLTKESQQLAEALHTTPDTAVGEPDIDDTQSILLTDTSTHNLSQQQDELFAVEGSDQEDSDDGNDNGSEHDGDRQGLMGNAHARRSWVDLQDLGENVVQNGGSRPGKGNLSEKAGIILVRRPYHLVYV